MSTAEDHGTRRLLDIGRELISELDSEEVLNRILEEARMLTGARYAALGVLDEDRRELERFLTSGVDSATHQAIGDLPHGRGVLGVLITDPRPLRLDDVGRHPQSYGFPPGHPVMRAFLGVPITIRGQAWGNLYLTEKADGAQFDQSDEDAVVVLAQWAAVAIENSRLYERSEARRAQAERLVRALEAARDITDAIGGIDELDRVLELIAKRGRALVGARSVVILLRERGALALAAAAGHGAVPIGRRMPAIGSAAGQVLESGRPLRVADVSAQLGLDPADLGLPGAHAALLVPMLHRGAAIGVLAAFDRDRGERGYEDAEVGLLSTFATSAANAVAIRQGVEAERLRITIAAADAERGRWSRELHDQTLQALGALRVLLAAAARRSDPDELRSAVDQAVQDIELEIENLRGIISDLRPSLLDDVGLRAALEALLDRRRQEGLEIDAQVELGPNEDSIDSELGTTIYRLVQEALTNVAKHARARHVTVAVSLNGQRAQVEVADDGRGFDPAGVTSGFGLTGMRERVYLAGGALELSSGGAGTTVRASFPLDSGLAAAEPA